MGFGICAYTKKAIHSVEINGKKYIYDEKCNFQRGSSKKKLETTDRRKCVYALET